MFSSPSQFWPNSSFIIYILKHINETLLTFHIRNLTSRNYILDAWQVVDKKMSEHENCVTFHQYFHVCFNLSLGFYWSVYFKHLQTKSGWKVRIKTDFGIEWKSHPKPPASRLWEQWHSVCFHTFKAWSWSVNRLKKTNLCAAYQTKWSIRRRSREMFEGMCPTSKMTDPH